MENSKTIYPFLTLIFASWIIELVMGWKVIEWWWGTAWYAWDSPGSQSMADELVSLGQMLSSARSGAQTVSVHGTSAGVVGVVFALFVGLHVLHAIWNGLLRPARKRWNLGARSPTDRENKRFRPVKLLCSPVRACEPERVVLCWWKKREVRIKTKRRKMGMKIQMIVHIKNDDGTSGADSTAIEVDVPNYEAFTGPGSFGKVFDQYERKVLEARNDVVKSVTEKYLDGMAQKKHSQKQRHEAEK